MNSGITCRMVGTALLWTCIEPQQQMSYLVFFQLLFHDLRGLCLSLHDAISALIVLISVYDVNGAFHERVVVCQFKLFESREEKVVYLSHYLLLLNAQCLLNTHPIINTINNQSREGEKNDLLYFCAYQMGQYIAGYSDYILMPELPEVQTVRRFLQDICLKPKPQKIKAIKAYYPNIIKQVQPSFFINSLIGQTFTDIDRYGKHLILKFNDWSVISHLRMEGKYIWYDKKYQKEKHDHIQFIFTNGNSIVYNDVRKFGTMHLVKRGEELQHHSISKLGPQVNDQTTFTEDYLSQAVENKNKQIKEVLLDQEIICGIGNIYADEILFAAKVHPEKIAMKLTQEQIRDIVKHGKRIIDDAIVNKGTTIRSFTSNHQTGNNQNVLKVYGMAGQPCSKCGTAIRKIKVGGRGTHFCPKCQK